MIPDNPELSSVNGVIPDSQGLPVLPQVDQCKAALSGKSEDILPGVSEGQGLKKSEGSELGLNSHLHKLDPEKVAEALIKYWPNLTAASLSLGLSHGVLHWHKRQASPWFMALFEQAKQITLDKIKTVMTTCAMEPKGFLDRAMTLRAYEPDVFNPARVVRIEGYKMTDGQASERMDKLGKIVDAQIVNAYTDRKERAQAKREGASLLPSGEQEGGTGESKV